MLRLLLYVKLISRYNLDQRDQEMHHETETWAW